MDDVALVTAVQRGDEEALADLFEETHGWTYSTCLNALRDPDAAQEATARVFEVSVRTRLAGARELRPAMIRLIHDACLEVEQELGKKRWLRRKGEQPPAAPDPRELRLVAWRAAGDLSGPDRILFAVSAGAGLTGRSIAAAVDAEKPDAIAKRLDAIREHVVADVLAARSLDDCPELRDTLRYSAKEPDAAARKKVHAHLSGRGKTPACTRCAAAYERWPLPALAALLPLTAVPTGLNDVILDRMERALRAIEDTGTDVIRVDTGTHAVIDGATGTLLEPEPEPGPEPAPEPARPRGPQRRFAGAATVTVVVAVLVLSTAGAVALNSYRRPTGVTEKLAAADRTDPMSAKPSPIAAPAGAHAAPVRRSASPTPRSTPKDDLEVPVARTSRVPARSPSIRPVAGTVAGSVSPSTPARTANPFAGFGTLRITGPGGTVNASGADQAEVTLSVAVPSGFDEALLDSALTWSGSYVLKKETQYADLGSGQYAWAALAAAPRCNTKWTITAKLTPPDGAAQTATTTVTIATC